MENNNQKWLIVLGVIATIAVVVSLFAISIVYQNNTSNQKRNQGNNEVQIANPASAYCQQMGGRSEIVTATDGSQSGLCKFEDGSQCEEWAFFRGECNSAGTQGDSGSSGSNISEITALDSTWNLYTNKSLYFSVKIPKNVFVTNNSQEATEVIESGNVVYLTNPSNFYYKNISDRIANQTSSELNDVKKTEGIPWGIVVRDVADENELDAFIKERYGSGCSFGGKSLSEQAGTYNVKIKGDGLDLSKTKCPINFILHIKYSPELKKVAIWDIGQDYNFRITSALDGTGGGDEEMADSFRFVK